MPGKQRLKLGVVCNEFFDPALGRMGGFGWVAKQVGWLFNAHPELGVDVVFLTGELYGNGCVETTTNGTRLLFCRQNAMRHWLTLKRENIDVLLAVDYRPNYAEVFRLLPRTPVIVWVQDPRPPADVTKVNTLRIPDEPGAPQGIGGIDCTSLVRFVRGWRCLGRQVSFASPAPRLLLPKCSETYGIPLDALTFLCYVLDAEPLPAPAQKHAEPRVIFLGRLDPIKRPWLFEKLAYFFPEVEFIFLGQNHFQGPGSWTPRFHAANVEFAGHVDGGQKRQLISSAWALVNTSIHEALPVSFIEALMYETPILGCQDPEGVTSRFGYYVGRADGDGMDGLPRFREGLEWLFADHERLLRLGREGRRWVEANHNHRRFLGAFWHCCEALGVKLPSSCQRAEGWTQGHAPESESI